MKKIIIIKYGELSTKKANIGFFISTLRTNIKNSLKNLKVDITYDKGRMFIKSEEQYFDEITMKLKKIFGIHEFFVGYQTSERDLDELSLMINNLLQEKNFNTFKVESKRSDKNYLIKSIDMDKILGGSILKKYKDKKVDVHNPEITIYLEIRSKETLLYFDKIKGKGGYPVGTLGKGLLMLSGGIDSPVAGYLAMKRGVKIEGIYFEAIPHTSLKAREKVLELSKKLSLYNNDLKLTIIDFTPIQEAIYKNIPHEYLITIMRRMMYRISEMIAGKGNCKILINGESIGQVASQTLTSMAAINRVVKKPVIRPLACFDKLEIIEQAKKIDTYDISILPYEDCCTVFVPEHPVINPEIEKCDEYEELIPYKDLIKKAVLNRKIIKISELKDTYIDLL